MAINQNAPQLRRTPLLNSLTITLPPIVDISALIFDGNTLRLVTLLDVYPFVERGHFPYRDQCSFYGNNSCVKLSASSPSSELSNDATSEETLLSGEFWADRRRCQ
jgi:hypothetical protein